MAGAIGVGGDKKKAIASGLTFSEISAMLYTSTADRFVLTCYFVCLYPRTPGREEGRGGGTYSFVSFAVEPLTVRPFRDGAPVCFPNRMFAQMSSFVCKTCIVCHFPHSSCDLNAASSALETVLAKASFLSRRRSAVLKREGGGSAEGKKNPKRAE